jgi:AcrR family transcriptional regulator
MRKKKMTREGILEHAEHLLRTEGDDACSMRRIAKDLGVASGTIYNYYGTRDELFVDLIDSLWKKSLMGLYVYINTEMELMDKLKLYHENLSSVLEERFGMGKNAVVRYGKAGKQIKRNFRKKMTEQIEVMIDDIPRNESQKEFIARWLYTLFMDEMAYNEPIDDDAWIVIGEILNRGHVIEDK